MKMKIMYQMMNKNNDELNKKIEKLKNENNKLLEKMQNDIERKMNDKINKIEKNKNEEEQKKIILLKKEKEEERKDILKRINKGSEETLKFKEFIDKKPQIKKYLYQKINNSFKEKENKLISNENNKRKEIMKPMKFVFNEMIENYQKYKDKKNLELEEKTQKLKNSWSERSLLIPAYKTKLSNTLEKEEKDMKKEKDNEKQKKKEMKNNQINYSKKIENRHIFIQKQFNDKQKNKSLDEDLIIRNHKILKTPLIKNNLNNYSNLIREKLFLKNNTKSSDSKNISNIDNDIKTKSINKSELLNKSNIIKLPNLNNNIKLKKYKIKSDSELSQDKINKSNINVKFRRNNLNLKRNRSKINQTTQIENVDYKGTNDINKLIEKNGFNNKTLELANCRIESLVQKQKQKSFLLKCEGGIQKNPSLGDEVCDMLIDSMTAKLSLIKEIDKIQQDYKNKLKLVDKSIENRISRENILNEKKNDDSNKSNSEQSFISSLSKEDDK